MSSQEVPFFQVDAFTDVPFAGNPAAVVLLPRGALPLGAALRQAIAAEMNLSETAFLECVSPTAVESDSSTGVDGIAAAAAAAVIGAGATDDFGTCERFRLRWFTPEIEVPLCGHATLASAAALFQGLQNPARTLRFDTASGELRVARGAAGRLEMDLPSVEAAADEALLPQGWQAIAQAATGSSGQRVDQALYSPSLRYLTLVLAPPPAGSRRAALEALQPDVPAMHAAHAGGGLVGVIVTVQGDGELGGGHDFCSRFFAPWAGIAEDPVTGSAHAVLGPLWAARLGSAKAELRARQCSPRGGELWVRAEGNRVRVSGHAALVLAGRLLLPAAGGGGT